MLMKHSSDTIGNRTRDLPACSAVPQPTAPTRAPQNLPLSFRNSDLPSSFPTLLLSTVIKYFWLYGFPPSMEKLKHKNVLSNHVSLLCSFLFIYHNRECIAAGVLLSEYCTVGRKRTGDVTWFVNYGYDLFCMRCHYLLESREMCGISLASLLVLLYDPWIQTWISPLMFIQNVKGKDWILIQR